jgi:hypothetical protein
MSGMCTLLISQALSQLASCAPSDWTSQAFNDSEDAETALCADRAVFAKRSDMKALIQNHIWKHIIHMESSAQIKGFQELFILLNADPGADNLRRLIVDYFRNSPPLREHLSTFEFFPPGVLSKLRVCVLSGRKSRRPPAYVLSARSTRRNPAKLFHGAYVILLK